MSDSQGPEEPQEPAKPPVPELPGITIEQEIARGGMGVVYRGRQDFLDRRVAVKFLAVDLGGEEFAQRFQREAKILAGINHPNIVACHMADTTPEGQSYLVMEFIDGPSLKAWVEKEGATTPMVALRLVKASARALAHAHAVGIIHRDVKPENILLEGLTSTAIDAAFPFTPKLVDLGLARMAQSPVGMDLTVPGSVMGTPATMSPEQFDDPDSVDFRSDIYGLGCCLYEMLVGQSPFHGAKLTDLVLRKRAEVPPNPCEENPSVPAMVGAYTQRLLASNRDDRPSSYAELDQELQMVIDALLEGDAGGQEEAQTIVSRPGAGPAVPPPQPQPTAGEPLLRTAELDFLRQGSGVAEPTAVGAGSDPATGAQAPAPTQPTPARGGSGRAVAIAAVLLLALGGGYWALQQGGSDPEPGETEVVNGDTSAAANQDVEEDAPVAVPNRAPDFRKQPVLERKLDLDAELELRLDAYDPDGDTLTYKWDFDDEAFRARSAKNPAHLTLELTDGLPGVVLPVGVVVSDSRGLERRLTFEVEVGECPKRDALIDTQAENAPWDSAGTWRTDRFPGVDMRFRGKQGRAKEGEGASLRTRLDDENYWEWFGTLQPTKGRDSAVGRGMLLVTYGDSGCGVRVDFDSKSDTWTAEVVDRVVGQDDFVPRPDRAEGKEVLKWMHPAENEAEPRAWVSIRREAERLVLQLGKHLTEPSGEVTIVKSDPVEINLTADSQEALQNGGAVELRVEQGICSFDLDRR